MAHGAPHRATAAPDRRADSYADAYTASNANSDAHSNPDANSSSDTYAHSDTYTDANPNARKENLNSRDD